MSNFSDAQYDLVAAVVDLVSEERDLDDETADKLHRAVFADGDVWDGKIWLPLIEFVRDKAERGLDE